MLKPFIRHLCDLKLYEEADSIRIILDQKDETQAKKITLAQLRKARNIEWELSAIKCPDRRLTSQDIYDYYIKAKDLILDNLKDRATIILVLKGSNRIENIELSSLKPLIIQWIQEKMLGLHHVIGNDTKHAWIELIPGEKFDINKTKKIIPEIQSIMASLPNIQKTEIYFAGDTRFYVVGKFKNIQNLNLVREFLKEKLDDYCEDKKSVTTGVAEPNQLKLDISSFKNTGSIPVPYSLNENTGLVVVPVSDINSFNIDDAEIKKVLKSIRNSTKNKLFASFGIVRQAAFQDNDLMEIALNATRGFEDQAKQIIEEAKKVKDQTTWRDFRSKYNDIDIARAYAIQVVMTIKSKIYATVDPQVVEDIFSKVWFDDKYLHGITKALITFKPGEDASLNTHISNHIKWGVVNVLNEHLEEQKGKQRLTETMGDEEESVEKGDVLHEIGRETYVVATEIKSTIEALQDTIASTWSFDPGYGTTEQAVDLFNNLASDIITAFPAVSEIFEDVGLLSKSELFKKKGLELPNIVCLDCGQKYVYERDWQPRVTRYKTQGCLHKKTASEHQIDWTDGTYNRDKAVKDLSYQYRLGYEKSTASNQGKVIVATYRTLSKYGTDEEDLFKQPAKLPVRKQIEMEEELGVVEKEKDYLSTLNKNSYEYRRITGLNFEIRTPDQFENVVSMDKIDSIMQYFKEKLKKSGTTATLFEQLKELVLELSDLVETRRFGI